MENIFQLKKNLTWFLRKCFSFILGGKHFPKVVKKIRNIILFTNYIKFDHQSFDCYIYFILNNFFSI
jgi:hypothetical protein